MKKEDILHVYQRAAFGMTPSKYKKEENRSRIEVVQDLFAASDKIEKLKVETPELDEFLENYSERNDRKKLRHLIQESRSKTIEFNSLWLDRMATSDAAFRERMTLFWATHFVVRSRNIIFYQKFNNTLRENALGNFRKLLLVVTQESAMLDYLNNQQNKKGSPNENFARELMELFTLGEATLYKEADIKESARAFTGWGHTFNGHFVNRKKLHDDDEKTFLGKTGNFDGEAIVDIILEQPECAYFICKKIYQYFVNDTINEAHIAEMVKVFYVNYDIEELMKFVFLSDWFYNQENLGSKIKSPIDLLVGLKKVVPVSFNNDKQLVYVERLLGQLLIEPPNVAGWPKGRGWIDANTMMVRLKLPSVLLKNGVIAFDVKGEFEDSFEEFNKQSNLNRKLNVTVDWNQFSKNFNLLTYQDITDLLIRCPINNGTKEFLKNLEQVDKQEYCIQLMSLPEYQLS